MMIETRPHACDSRHLFGEVVSKRKRRFQGWGNRLLLKRYTNQLVSLDAAIPQEMFILVGRFFMEVQISAFLHSLRPEQPLLRVLPCGRSRLDRGRYESIVMGAIQKLREPITTGLAIAQFSPGSSITGTQAPMSVVT